MVLDAAYEATFAAAVINAVNTGANKIFLTLLGGGAFGNDDAWTMAAIERAFKIHADRGLDVRIVSYSRSKAAVAVLCTKIMKADSI